VKFSISSAVAGGPSGAAPNLRCGSSCAGAPGPADQPHRPVRIRDHRSCGTTSVAHCLSVPLLHDWRRLDL